MRCVRGFKIETQFPVVQRTWPRNLALQDQVEDRNFTRAIKELLMLGAIEACCPVEGQFLSSYFLVPKQDGSYRFVLNLKNLNEFLQTDHFKMKDWRTAVKIVNRKDFMAKVDLKNAYYSLPVDQDSRKLLRFVFKGQLYEFRCLPNGLSIAPYIFTKVLKPVVSSLRERGFILVIYLDDLLCIGEIYESCSRNVAESVSRLLESLEFMINYEKSILKPTQVCPFLGVSINTIDMVLELPDEKRNSGRTLVQVFSQ